MKRIKLRKKTSRTSRVQDPGNEEFYRYIKDLVHHPIVLQMKKYPHHCGTSCYQHCLNVAYYNYRICRHFGLDARSAARAGMLHDLFLYDWHNHRKKTGDPVHAMTHPHTAHSLGNLDHHTDRQILRDPGDRTVLLPVMVPFRSLLVYETPD